MNKSNIFTLLFAGVLLFQFPYSLADKGERQHRSPYNDSSNSKTTPKTFDPDATAQASAPAKQNSCPECFSWDLDGSGKAEPLTDGLIFIRYLFGFEDEALVSGAVSDNATRKTSEQIIAFLDGNQGLTDIDDDSKTEPLTDGLLLIRYLFGFEDSALTSGALGEGHGRSESSEISDFIATQLPETQYDEPSDPELEWDLTPATAAQVGTDQAAVDAVIDHILTDIAVQSVMVTKDGFLIGERYATGYDENSLGTSWSMAKSFYSAAIGAAISEGKISSVDQKASEIITEWQDTNKANITLHQMLQMRSGYSRVDEVFFNND